jgi:hypothetical protein
MRTPLVIAFLVLFALSSRAQSVIDSIVVRFTNVNSVTTKIGAYVNDGNTVLIAADQQSLVVTKINSQTPNSLSLTTSDSKASGQLTIQYDSLSSTVNAIAYHRMGGIPFTILDSSFQLLDLAMHHVGDHFHSEFHGTDVTTHMNVTASGHHDGGSFGTYDQTVTFKATDSSVITVDLYATIFSGVPERSSQPNDQIIVYPLLASDHITVVLPSDDITTTITLSDAIGRTIASYRYSESGHHTIPLSDMAQGLYMISDSKGRTARLIVAR